MQTKEVILIKEANNHHMKCNVPFTKKFITSHAPTDDDLLHYDIIRLAPFEG